MGRAVRLACAEGGQAEAAAEDLPARECGAWHVYGTPVLPRGPPHLPPTPPHPMQSPLTLGPRQECKKTEHEQRAIFCELM